MAATVNYYPPASSAAPAVTQDAVALERAQSLLGATIDTVVGTHFQDGTGWAASVLNNGAGVLSATANAGVLNATSSATASGQCIIFPNYGAGFVSHVSNARTVLWYSRTIARLTTGVDAVARINCIGVYDNTAQTGAHLGVEGATSTTHYVARVLSGGVGTAVATAIALDTNAWHVFEMWNDLTNINFAIDETVVQTIAVASIGTNPIQYRTFVNNGGTAAARAVDYDFMYLCMEENG
jgi:hypothetical protein